MADEDGASSDAGPPGVDEPVPPGMEDDGPPGVDPVPAKPSVDVPAAGAQTVSPGSAQAPAYSGYSEYGGYDATNAGYGYDTNYWNYYSAGSYYQPAYSAAATGGTFPLSCCGLFLSC
jgi:hypothetical protein